MARRSLWEQRLADDPLNEFLDQLYRFGLALDGPPVTDGQVHRCADKGSRRAKDSGWYRATWLSGDRLAASFGSHRTGEKASWVSGKGATPTRTDREALDRIRAERDTEAQAKRRRAAIRAANTWPTARLADPAHPYLAAKGVRPHGLRQMGTALLVPIQGPGGEWRGIQRIPAEPGALKKFDYGTDRSAAGWCWIGEPTGADRIVICEGWATGASIYEATGLPVAAAMDAGGVRKTAPAIRDLYPRATIILAADNDANGVGQGAADAAARAVAGLVAIPPKTDTDWNDTAQAEGLEAVRAGMAAAVPPDGEPEEYLSAPETIPLDEAIARQRAFLDEWAGMAGPMDDWDPEDLEGFELVEAEHADLLIAPPGMGKSTGVVDTLARAEAKARADQRTNGVSEFFSPRIEVLEDMAERARKAHPAFQVAVVKGRLHGWDGESPTGPNCYRPKRIAEAEALGLPVSSTCCAVERNGQWIRCPFFDECPYQQSLREAEGADLRLMAQEYLFLQRPRAWGPPARVIVDEDPTAKFVATDDCNLDWLRVGKDDTDAAIALAVAEITEGRHPRPAFEAAGWTRKEVEAAAKGGGANEYDDPTPLEALPDEEGARPKNTGRRMLNRMLDEWKFPDRPLKSASVREGYEDEDGKLFLRWRRRVQRAGFNKAPLLVLDATARPEILELAFGRSFTVTRIDPALNGEIYHAPWNGTKRAFEADFEGAWGDVEGACKGPPGALITQKDAIDRATKDNRLPAGWAVGWFGAIRGSNTFEGCDRAVIAGRQQPPTWAMINAAKALTFDRAEPIAEEPNWRQAVVALSDGSLAKADRHVDPTVEALRWLSTEAELLQAIGRLRLVHAKTPKQVLLMNRVPLPLHTRPVSIDLATRRIERGRKHGDKLAVALSQGDDVVCLSAVALNQRFPAIWATPKAAERWLEREAPAKTPVSVYSTIYANGGFSAATFSVAEIRGPNARRWTRVLTRWPEARTRAEVEKHYRTKVVAFRWVSDPPPTPVEPKTMPNALSNRLSRLEALPPRLPPEQVPRVIMLTDHEDAPGAALFVGGGSICREPGETAAAFRERASGTE